MTRVNPSTNTPHLPPGVVMRQTAGGIALIFPESTSANVVRDIIDYLKSNLKDEKTFLSKKDKQLDIAKFRDPHTRLFGIDMRIKTPTRQNKQKFIVDPDYRGTPSLQAAARCVELGINSDA